MSKMTILEEAFEALSPKLGQLMLLDLCHISLTKHLKEIVNCDRLIPHPCKVFNENLLYFSYGAPHYRPKDCQTQNPLEFPLAFVFSTSILENMCSFFPFDTGAMSGDSFGGKWRSEFPNIKDYSLSSNPACLVECFYKSNENYLSGRVVPSPPAGSKQPILKLHRFLSANLSKQGIDQRQRTIECSSREEVSLIDTILWIGYPKTYSALVAELWEKQLQGFKCYEYEADVNENPAHLAEYLEKVAREYFQHRVESPYET